MCTNWELPIFGWAMDAFTYRRCLYWFLAFWDINSLISWFSSGTPCCRPTPNLNHYSQLCIWVQKSQPLYSKCLWYEYLTTYLHLDTSGTIRSIHCRHFYYYYFAKCSFLGHLAQGSAAIWRRPITKSLDHASWYIILWVLESYPYYPTELFLTLSADA